MCNWRVIFEKKAPAPCRRGPTRKETYTPPEEFSSNPYGMRKHCFLSLPANCRQAGLLNRANDVNPHGGVINLAGFVVFMFGPSSIKVYYTNREGTNQAHRFFGIYRRPIRLSWFVDEGMRECVDEEKRRKYEIRSTKYETNSNDRNIKVQK